MHLLSFIPTEKNENNWGVQVDDRVYSGLSLAPTLDDFIRLGPSALEQARTLARSRTALSFSMKEICMQAPIQSPGKIIAIGLNYWDHCRETGATPPKQPVVFAKFPTSIIGPADEICWSTQVTDQVDWEVELGVVIGRTARNVSEADALDYVFGYTVANDATARDLQAGDGQWVRGKSLDTFCPVGPAIITADEIPDPQVLGIRSWVNGKTMQDSNTREMIFNVRYLVAFLSRAFTLKPGDLIVSGTPHGIGAARKPPIFLHDGDVVEMEVDGIGRLRNVCRVLD